jgi:hypothetical protein
VMLRDEIEQSSAARNRKFFYMEDEDSWGLPEVQYCNLCYCCCVCWNYVVYVSGAAGSNLLTSIIQPPETRVCMKDGDTWGLPEAQYCNLCYWPSSVVPVKIMYVSSAEWSIFLTSIIYPPETRVCMKDEETWGLPEVQYCNLCYWPSSVVPVKMMYVSRAEWSNLLTSINQPPETRVGMKEEDT